MALSTRLRLRMETVIQVSQEANLLLERCKDESGVPEEEFIRVNTKLSNAIQYLNKEFYQFPREQENEDLLNAATEEQLKAETILADIEAVWKCFLHTRNNTTGPSQSKLTSKLPILEIKKFNGNITSFHEFWDRFEAAVNRKDIEDVEKMSYLMALLEGPALSSINGIEISNNNYIIAVETLKKLYGRKDAQIDAHYEELYKITKCSYDVYACRDTYNTVERHLRVLQALGEDINGNHLRKLILNKFPDKIIYELNLIMGPENNSVSDIRNTIEKIISSMERSKVPRVPVDKMETVSTTQVLQSNIRKRPHNQNKIGYKPAVKKFKRSCIFCYKDHYNDQCNLKLPDKRNKLGKRCYNCFQTGHRSHSCKIKRPCIHCKGPHNRALCPKTEESTDSTSALVSPSLTKLEPITVLQTVMVKVYNKNNEMYEHCRTLLDCGSHRSYISARMQKKLNLIPVEENYLMVYTFGSNQPRELYSPVVNISIETKMNIKCDIQVNVVNVITEKVEENSRVLQLIPPHMKKSIVLADDYSGEEKIDLLIGNDYYYSFIKEEKVQLQDNMYIVNSDFGWILTGKCINSRINEHTLSMLTYTDEATYSQVFSLVAPDPPLIEDNIKKIWDLEAIGITDSPKTKRDEEAVDRFNETIVFRDHRYYITWPWIEYPPDLPDNLGIAYGRLRSLLKRSDHETIKLYDVTINNQLEAGIIEKAPPPVRGEHPIHYLPHHCVIQKDKTTKLRIVYDGSAKLKDCNSLNQCFYKGPLLLEDLIGIIIRFRRYKYGVVADVEKAFLQIDLQENDRDVTRFLWIKDTRAEPTDENIVHYRFCRVPFGVISSPFILAATINYHLNKNKNKIAKELVNNIYVDNLLVSTDTVAEVSILHEQATSIFREMSMNLREWQSNCKEFEEKINGPTSNTAKEINVLGLKWNVTRDVLTLKTDFINLMNQVESVETKREVLKIMASIYDPCGFIAPLLLPVKIFLQDLWKLKYKWDTKLSVELKERWSELQKYIHEISEFEVPRALFTEITEKTKEKTNYQLHCLCDSSMQAYTAVVYLRSGIEKPKVSFIISKSRLKSLKDNEHLKIPKLELLGALIGCRLLQYVEKVLQINIERQILWTDSKVVIGWINTNKLLPPFIARRVKEIKENKNLELRYVPSEENSADVGTRPLKGKLKDSRWTSGPEFLNKPESQWPVSNQLNSKTLACVEGPPSDMNRNVDEERRAITAEESDKQQTAQIDQSQSEENEKLIKMQKKYFEKEYNGMITDLARSLQLYKDNEGILRCKGRFAKANWHAHKKHPILLPRNDDYTYDIIHKIHQENYHVGVSHTLSILREKYWVPKGRSQVQKVIRKCVQCKKYGGGPFKLPPIPDLPEQRTNYSAPFVYTGLDYLGPLYIDTDHGKEKRWICLYTCLAVRAIHLEIVADLTAEECLLALRRFISTRGLPKMITSDNATQFKLTSEVLCNSYCIENKIKWKFIPQLAPWYGGFYERLVGLVKHCLIRTIEKHLLRDTQLQTVVKEVEAVINTRPLTYVSSDLEHVLTPADFLHLGGSLVSTPAGEVAIETATPETETKQRLIEGWKRGQKILNEFIIMFTNQYLPSLREKRTYHREPRVKYDRVPKIGEIVQIKSQGNRSTWLVGKIKELISSSDGYIRVAKVETKPNTILTRSVSHLYPLELDDDINSDSQILDTQSQELSVAPPSVPELTKKSTKNDLPLTETEKKDTVVCKQRPKRLSADKARELIKNWTSQLVAIS